MIYTGCKEMTQEELRGKIIQVLNDSGLGAFAFTGWLNTEQKDRYEPNVGLRDATERFADQILSLFPKPIFEWSGEVWHIDFCDKPDQEGVSDVIKQFNPKGKFVHISITEIKERK